MAGYAGFNKLIVFYHLRCHPLDHRRIHRLFYPLCHLHHGLLFHGQFRPTLTPAKVQVVSGFVLMVLSNVQVG